MLHIICCGKSADANCCLNLFAGVADNNAFIIIFLDNTSKNKTRCSLVDANPSVHTHCLCVLHALLEMIRELKMHIQFVSVMLFPAVVFHIIVF